MSCIPLLARGESRLKGSSSTGSSVDSSSVGRDAKESRCRPMGRCIVLLAMVCQSCAGDVLSALGWAPAPCFPVKLPAVCHVQPNAVSLVQSRVRLGTNKGGHLIIGWRMECSYRLVVERRKSAVGNWQLKCRESVCVCQDWV